MIVREIPWRPPEQIAAAWQDFPYLAWLDSAAEDARGRYSYLAADPFEIICVQGEQAFIDGAAVSGSLFDVLRRRMAHYALSPQDRLPFVGGAIGFLGYELAGGDDPHECRHSADLPAAHVAFYDTVLVFDHPARRCWVASTGLPETGVKRQSRAAARAGVFEKYAALPALPLPSVPSPAWRAEMTQPDYAARVSQVLDYIRAGDIYQANLTMRFVADRPAGLNLMALYRHLRSASPAPFAAFLSCGPALSLLSLSPERFLHLQSDGAMEARPIKGTRPRHADPAQDVGAHDALRDSVKDRAENLMITDLLRNDLARVAVPGSVAVPVLHAVESFANVHHLVSVVTAQLRPGLNAVDLLRASFPGGSITGAPKMRAMQIIDELEPPPRGPYCGAIVRIGFDGAMDSSIVIRTLVATQTELRVQAGGGIVADSDPDAEWAELQLKAAPLLRAIPA